MLWHLPLSQLITFPALPPPGACYQRMALLADMVFLDKTNREMLMIHQSPCKAGSGPKTCMFMISLELCVRVAQAGGLDKLTLDSVYDDAGRRESQNVSYDRRETGPMANSMMQPVSQDPFYALNTMAAPNFLQMAAMAQQQQAFLQQQQMMVGVQQSHPLATVNPFANPYGDYSVFSSSAC